MIKLPIYVQNNRPRLNMINISGQLVSALWFLNQHWGSWTLVFFSIFVYLNEPCWSSYPVENSGWQVYTSSSADLAHAAYLTLIKHLMQIMPRSNPNSTKSPPGYPLHNDGLGFKKKNRTKHVTAWLTLRIWNFLYWWNLEESNYNILNWTK